MKEKEENRCEECGKDCDILFGHYSHRSLHSGFVYKCEDCFMDFHGITVEELFTVGGEQ